MGAFPFPSFIDATARNEFASCEQKWSYGSIQLLEAKSKFGNAPGGSIHLHAGAAYARGLEVLRKCFYSEGMRLDDAMFQAQCEVLKHWGLVEPMFSWQHEDEKKTLDAVLSAVEYYPTQWPLETDHVQPYQVAPGKHAIEFTFAIPLDDCIHPETGEPMLYCGRFDMLGEYNAQKFPVDDKTTTMLGAKWPEQWDLRAQFDGYCWACREYGFDVAGLIVRGMGFFRDKANGINHRAAECITYREDWRIARWRKQLKRDFDRMVEVWRTGEASLNLGEACVVYGSRCPFYLLCNSPKPELWLGEYGKRTWNPLAKVDD